MKYFDFVMTARKLLALGDSHLEALEFASNCGLLTCDQTEFAIVPGATAVGLNNPNSITDAIGMFTERIQACERDEHILLHLGEVDCGFVIWWRAMKYNESVDKQFDQSILAYQNFVENLLGRGFNQICITGASLPTIRDGVDFGEAANKRSEVVVPLRERTVLTLRYNAELKALAMTFGIHYFDISDAVMNFREGIVSDFFRSKDSSDHHLDTEKTAAIWAGRCNEFIAAPQRCQLPAEG